MWSAEAQCNLLVNLNLIKRTRYQLVVRAMSSSIRCECKARCVRGYPDAGAALAGAAEPDPAACRFRHKAANRF